MSESTGSESTTSDLIIGRNPVTEAIQGDRSINKLMIAKGAKEGSIKKIIQLADEKKLVVQYVERNKLDQLADGENHQGVIAFVSPYAYHDLKDVLKSIEGKEHQFIVLLDGVVDPHNLGSVIRTSNAVGVDAVVIPKRRAVAITPTVAKTSAGAIEYVPVCRVTNLGNTIDELKEAGFWITGADMNGEQAFYQADLKGKVALVIGGEGTGIGKRVSEKCDFLVKIPMVGSVTSLNASVAASIMMYEVMRQNEKS